MLENIFPNGTIQYSGQIGLPEEFELTERELEEIANVGAPLVEPAPPQLWSLFWEELSESTIYQKIKSQAALDPAILIISVEFLNWLTDAKMGLVNCVCMQEKIDELIAAGDFVQTDLDEFNALLVNANLDSELTAAFPV